MSEIPREHLQWCRMTIGMIRVGGIWGIPRSGLVFTKRSETAIALTARMPWMPEMEGTITPALLREQQQGEYEETARVMGAAGITVTDETEA